MPVSTSELLSQGTHLSFRLLVKIQKLKFLSNRFYVILNILTIREHMSWFNLIQKIQSTFIYKQKNYLIMHKVTDSYSFVHSFVPDSILIVLIPLGRQCMLWLNLISIYVSRIHIHINIPMYVILGDVALPSFFFFS